MNSCSYRDILGKPETGVHQYRFFGFAIVDTALTAVLALFVASAFKTTFWHAFLIVMLIGLIMHRLFCVNTKLTRLVFGKNIDT